MKKFLLSTVALMGLSATAMAADLPMRAAPPAFAPVVPVFTWTGFYVGVNAGYAFGNNNNNRSVTFGPGTFANAPLAAGTVTLNSGRNDGFVGGGQVGYNWQMGALVLGAEADIQWADIGRRRGGATFVGGGFPAPAVGGLPNTIVTDGNGRNDWFGTVRGRLGFAADRALFYVTGGLAYSDGRRGNCGAVFACGGGSSNWGWTVGAGIDYAITNNVIVGVEGLWVNFNNNRNRTAGLAYDAPTATLFVGNRRNDDFAVVRARLSYKF